VGNRGFHDFLRNHKLPRYLLRLGIGGFLILFALEYRQVGNWGLLMIFGGIIFVFWELGILILLALEYQQVGNWGLLMIFGGIIFCVLGIGDFNTFGFGVSTSGQLGT
jgi:hypothetical protein